MGRMCGSTILRVRASRDVHLATGSDAPTEGHSPAADGPVYRAAVARTVDAMLDPALLLDADGCIVEANSRAVGTLGATATQLRSAPLSAIVLAGGITEWPSQLNPGESSTVPARLASPSAGTVSIELHLTRLALDGPPLFLCVLRPLPALASALYNQLATLLDQAPWLCFQKDTVGRYEYINRRWAEVHGVSQHAVVGQTDEDLFAAEVAKPLRENDRLVAETARVLVTEEEVPAHDGPHFFLVYKFPIRDVTGRITSTGGIAADITEGHRLRAALHAATQEEQRRFSRELHDGVGQELATLSMFTAKLLRDFGADNTPLTRGLNELLDAIGRTGQSCRDIARGLSPIEDAVTGLRDALQELVERFGGAIDVPVVLFSEEHLAPLQISLEASNHLYRIAQEALSNAVRHSGGTRIMLSLQVTEEVVRLTITDNGRGADPPEARGMGLQTMRYRAEGIGARLVVQATRDGGTELTCELGNHRTAE